MIDPNRLILLGEIGAAHGIRGEVSIRTFTDSPADIAAYGPLSDKTGKRLFTIAGLRVTPKTVIARFKGVEDRTAAETLRNIGLYVPRSSLPELESGAYYHEDLAGLMVVDASGANVGSVVGVVNFGAGDLLEIARPQERETLLLPFTDAAVPDIDLKAGRITVVAPAYVNQDDPEPADDTVEPIKE